MNRHSIKVVGAQGQGVNSVGEMLAKGLKRAGYCVFGYREYNSLIKGGHSSYQLDVSNEEIESTETMVDILVCFNHHGLEKNLREVKEGGIVLHQTRDWEFSKEDAAFLKKRTITVLFLPADEILARLKLKPILANMLITSVVWHLLGRAMDDLRSQVREQFGHKGEEMVQQNLQVIDEGIRYCEESAGTLALVLPKPASKWKGHLLLTGSHAMALGLVHAGCRLYAGYPMTPSSPLLSYIAEIQNETGMVIKQAEDEITAAQIMSGAMFMGTRAATGTSGGGFDLMTETVSLNGILENPAVFILAQRPGPATGLPTWTAQGDLFLAIGSAHGEFPRLVLSVSDGQDCFDLMNTAFNYAERFQTPVIVMTDKQTAEALFTQQPYDQKKAKLDRGHLVTDPKQLAALKATDRYDPSVKTGVSPRWLPGAKAATYVAQGDEHNAEGSVDESAENAVLQMEKRMRKMATMKKELPEPELLGAKNPDILLVSWGSNKGVILDALKDERFAKKSIGLLHYTYLWPLKTERFRKLHDKAKKTVLIECNHEGQLGKFLTMESGITISNRVLKYDGRPFFVDELANDLASLLA